MKKYEYKMVKQRYKSSGLFSSDSCDVMEEDKKDVDKLGKEGWELVTAVPMNVAGGSKGMILYFRRELE